MNNQLLYEILDKFNIRPKNPSIYLEAFTHPSYTHEHNINYNYQRLEFLGDSIISYVISNFLYKFPTKLDEGIMSNIKIKIENSKSLAEYAKNLKLDNLIIVGNGIKNITDNMLEDIFEAFIGAIYLDQGIQKVIKIFNFLIFDNFCLDNYLKNLKPPKSLFQEYIHANEQQIEKRLNKNNIHYKSYCENDLWYCKLFYNNILYGEGSGDKKIIAEENAAANALSKLSTK